MSARRGVQESGRTSRRKQAGQTRGRVTAIGANDTAVRANGEKLVGGEVTDAATGQALDPRVLAERDSDEFMEWLGAIARRAVGYTCLVKEMARTFAANPPE